MWPRLPNKSPIYTHFWGCGIAVTKSKQGLEPRAALMAHLHSAKVLFFTVSNGIKKPLNAPFYGAILFHAAR